VIEVLRVGESASFCYRALATESKQKMVKTRAQRIKRMSVVDALCIRSQISVKSARYCKTVSKHLAKLQLAESGKNSSLVVCPSMGKTMKLYSMDAKRCKLSLLSTIDPSQRTPEVFMYMISSYNGIICCVNMIYDEDVENKFCDLQIWICNPITKETLLLPQGTPSFEFEPSIGVAYGSDVSDYKVYRIFCTGKIIPEERGPAEGFYVQEGRFFTKYGHSLAYECEVYSSSTGSWKNIGTVPCLPMSCSLRPYRRTGHIFVGGKVYWLVSLDAPGKILSVDLEGKFEVINLPAYADGLREDEQITEASHLINLKGSLGLLVLHPENMDVWVWKHDGERYSWVFQFKDVVPIKDDELILAVTALDNKIICVNETHWRIYDMETEKWKRRKSPRTGFRNPVVLPFTESVLPCNGGVKQ